MMDSGEILAFDFEGGGRIRFGDGPDGEPWPVGTDVASILGYKRARDAVQRHCKCAVKHGIPTTGGVKQMPIIPESDVYRLITNSQLPEAKKFEKWLFEEVLPSIRKTGKYQSKQSKTPSVFEADPVLAMLEPIRQLRQLQIEHESRISTTEVRLDQHDDLIEQAQAAVKVAMSRLEEFSRQTSRKRSDKAEAVDAILSRPECVNWSDRRIAEACHVSHPYVASRRSKLGITADVREINRDGKVFNMRRRSPAAQSETVQPQSTDSDEAKPNGVRVEDGSEWLNLRCASEKIGLSPGAAKMAMIGSGIRIRQFGGSRVYYHSDDVDRFIANSVRSTRERSAVPGTI
jgi:prophage antirepressor-like protein